MGRDWVDLLRAASLLIVFPMRIVILIGLIVMLAGEPFVGAAVFVAGVAGFFVTVRIIRPGGGRAKQDLDPATHFHGEIRSDRISYGVASRIMEGRVPGSSPLSKKPVSYR